MGVIKGEAIRFIAGKYAGKKGWFDDSRAGDRQVVPVIVDLGSKGEKVTVVYRSSIKVETVEEPGFYAHAVLQQCPDIEKNLVTVCRQLAKCDIEKDEEGFVLIMGDKLEEAKDWQKAKGSKAMYRKIDFDFGL